VAVHRPRHRLLAQPAGQLDAPVVDDGRAIERHVGVVASTRATTPATGRWRSTLRSAASPERSTSTPKRVVHQRSYDAAAAPSGAIGTVRRNVTKRATSPGPPVLAPRPTAERFQPPNGWRPTTAPVVWRLT